MLHPILPLMFDRQVIDSLIRFNVNLAAYCDFNVKKNVWRVFILALPAFYLKKLYRRGYKRATAQVGVVDSWHL